MISLQKLGYQSMLICGGAVAVDTCLSTHVPVSIKTTVCLIQKHTSQKSHAFINPSIYAWEQVCERF